jgi:outer membrane protein assembly factor BamB
MLKMKKITLIVYLSFLFTHNILPQNYKYAWIPGIQSELPSKKNNIENIVKDINNKKEISFVIITCSLSKDGKNEGIDSAKTVLDELKVPYFILPGYDDVELNESCFREFKDLWKDNKFAFNYKGIEHIGLNCGIFMHENGHFRVEDTKWLDSLLATLPDNEQVLFYSDFPTETGIDNMSEVTNLLSTHNIKAILFSFQKLHPPANVNGIPVLSEKSIPDDSNYWKYSLVENTPDSLYLFEVTNNGIGEMQECIAKNISKISKIDSIQFINFTSNPLNKSTSIKANVLWQKNLKETLSAPIIATRTNIYAATENGNIYCFDYSGSLLWQNKTGETIFSKPVLSDSILIAGSVEGDLISLNATNGKIIQTIGLNEPVTSQLITFDAEYNGSSTACIIAGTSQGSLYCYTINSFEMVWDNHSAQGLIASEPLLVNDRIIYGSRDGYLYCVDASSGIINWKLLINNSIYNSPILCKPVSDDKNTFISPPDKNILSIDLMLGKTNWQKNNFDASNSIEISKSKEYIYIKSCKDNFFIVSAKNGKLVKEIRVGYGHDTAPGNILEWNKNILFASQNGIIYLIDKNYKWDPLLYTGTGSIPNIYNVNDNIFAASNNDGKIVVFRLE